MPEIPNKNNCDFSGWATKANVLCADGRTIRKNAFAHQDGSVVPLVWCHGAFKDIHNIVGKALLEHRDDGMYAYCFLNETETAATLRQLVTHGDIEALSIAARDLQHDGNKGVVSGEIYELSVVPIGANRLALIDSIAHGIDDGIAYVFGDAGDVSCMSDETYLEHSEKEEENVDKEHDNSKSTEKRDSSKATEKQYTPEEVQKIVDSMNDEQRAVMYGLLYIAGREKAENISEEDDETMATHSLFQNGANSAARSNFEAAFADIVNETRLAHGASLKDAFYSAIENDENSLEHADYGVENLDIMFPDATYIDPNGPAFIRNQPTGWVSKILSGTHKSPISKIRFAFANLTEDAARARGYVKGDYKKEEIFNLIKRETAPTTIYKKQRLDRDDVIDITSWNVVQWLKSEMRTMFDEELARAAIFSDGRGISDPDHIDRQKIRPVVFDTAENFYCVEHTVTAGNDDEYYKNIIKTIVAAADTYEGSGNVTLFAPANVVTKMLLLEDGIGHRLYKTINDLAAALLVSDIERVPAHIVPEGVVAVALDLKDYTFGADKGGETEFFDDFDIDFNQLVYLYEGRCSGSLTKYHSAFVVKNSQ